MPRSLFAILVAILAILGAGAPGVAQAEESDAAKKLKDSKASEIIIEFAPQNKCNADTFGIIVNAADIPRYYTPDGPGRWEVHGSFSPDSKVACPFPEQRRLTKEVRNPAGKALLDSLDWPVEDVEKMLFSPFVEQARTAGVILTWKPDAPTADVIEWRPSYNKVDGGTKVLSRKYINGEATDEMRETFIPDATAKDAISLFGIGAGCTTLNMSGAGCGGYGEIYPALAKEWVAIGSVSGGRAWGIGAQYPLVWGWDVGLGKYFPETRVLVGGVVGVNNVVKPQYQVAGYRHAAGGLRLVWDPEVPLMASVTPKYGMASTPEGRAGQVSVEFALTFTPGRGYERASAPPSN